jgi:hypothetical protein
LRDCYARAIHSSKARLWPGHEKAAERRAAALGAGGFEPERNWVNWPDVTLIKPQLNQRYGKN